MLVQGVHYADLPYFVGLATLTIYIGAHRGLSSRNRQQLSVQQVRCCLTPPGCQRTELQECLCPGTVNTVALGLYQYTVRPSESLLWLCRAH